MAVVKTASYLPDSGGGCRSMFAQRAFSAFRPGGMKIRAGIPVIEPGMEEHDFKELADAGMRLLGERAQHSAGRGLLGCLRLGDLPGVGMVVIDGTPRIGRSRNTPLAGKVPEVVA